MNNKKFIVTDEHIQALKRGYYRSGYGLDEEAPEWLFALEKVCESDLGMLALASPTGVNVGESSRSSDRLWPDLPCMLMAGLAGRIRDRKKRVAVGLPPKARDIPLFLACTTVLRNVFSSDDSSLSRGARGVLVVSPDVSLRSKYCDLYVGTEHIDASFPGSRMLYTGKLQTLNASALSQNVSGVCFFLPHRRTMPTKIAIIPDLVIMDLRYSRLATKSDEIVSWVCAFKSKVGVIALYTCGDRITKSSLMRARFHDFPFDHVGIDTCLRYNRFIPSTESLDIELAAAPKALERRHTIQPVSLPKEAGKTISDLISVLDEHRKENNVEINRVRWIFSVYCQLAVPLVWYENSARDRGRWVPKNVVKRIGSSTHDVGRVGPVLQTLRILLQQLDNLLEAENPKAAALAGLLAATSTYLSDERRMLLLVRDEVMQNALSSWLSVSEFPGEGWLEHVDVVAASNYQNFANNTYEYFVSPGSLHYRYRWILGGSIGSDAQFCVYPHELSIVEAQIRQFYDFKYLDYRASARIETVRQLTDMQLASEGGCQSDYPRLELTVPSIATPQPKPTKKKLERVSGFEDLLSVVRKREQEAEMERAGLYIDSDTTFECVPEAECLEISAEDVDGTLQDEFGVSCHRIEVRSDTGTRGTMWLADNGFVEFIHPETPDELIRQTPNQLSIGDILLVVDQRSQLGVFERLIEISENNPKMKYVASYREMWRNAINVLASKFRGTTSERIDYLAMHKALMAEGITVSTTQTLQNWINNVVIGPADLSSIVAVGRVTQVRDLWKRPKEFHRNFERIRSMHRSIGRRVARIMRQTFLDAVSSDSSAEERFDERLGIALDELVQAISVYEVNSVEQRSERINPDLVGVLLIGRE